MHSLDHLDREPGEIHLRSSACNVYQGFNLRPGRPAGERASSLQHSHRVFQLQHIIFHTGNTPGIVYSTIPQKLPDSCSQYCAKILRRPARSAGKAQRAAPIFTGGFNM